MNKSYRFIENNYTFKLIWGKSHIGLAVDKKINKDITFPLTTFFFWPRENGWELLKIELSNKPWITKEDRIAILNGYTQIINYWLVNVQNTEGITKLVQDSSTYNFELLANF